MTTYKEYHAKSLRDPAGFWSEKARLIDWQTPFSRCSIIRGRRLRNGSSAARTNLCHNAIDRHLAARGDQPALIYISTETGDETAYTTASCTREVNRCAAILARPGRRTRRSRTHLHADDSRSDVRDARVRAHRRDPFGGVRRLCCGEPGHTHRRCAAEGDVSRPMPDARRQGGAIQAPGGRSDAARRSIRQRKCCIVDRGLDRDAARAGPRLDYATLRAST